MPKANKRQERQKARQFTRGKWEDEYMDPVSEEEDRKANEKLTAEMLEMQLIWDDIFAEDHDELEAEERLINDLIEHEAFLLEQEYY